MDFLTTIGNKFCKNLPVSHKNVISGLYTIIIFTFQLIVPRRSTLVVTEFFIGPADDALPALHTIAFRDHEMKIREDGSVPTGDQENQTGGMLGNFVVAQSFAKEHEVAQREFLCETSCSFA